MGLNGNGKTQEEKISQFFCITSKGYTSDKNGQIAESEGTISYFIVARNMQEALKRVPPGNRELKC